jgi:hypothetical protein
VKKRNTRKKEYITNLRVKRTRSLEEAGEPWRALEALLMKDIIVIS